MIHPTSGLEDHPDGSGDLNPILNSNWLVLNNFILHSYGLTASQSVATVTSSANLFTADDVGATIRWLDGTVATITGFTNATTVTATPSQTVASQTFELYRTSETPYSAFARGITKQTRMLAADDTKVLAWDNALGHFKTVARPGYGVTLGRVLYGGGAGADALSSADFTWDNSTKLLFVNGSGNFTKTVFIDKQSVTVSGASTVLDFSTSNHFDITVNQATTIDANNIKAGAFYILVLRQDATGGRAITFAAKFKFPVGYTVIATLAASAITIVHCLATTTGELICIDAGTSPLTLKNLIISQATVTYAATTDINLDKEGYQTISLTGNLTLTTSNRAAGKSVSVRLICDGTNRNLTFPAWKFVNNAAPASITANKTAILALVAFGANDTDIIASYAVEP